MNGDTFMILMLVLTAFFAGCGIAFIILSYKCDEFRKELKNYTGDLKNDNSKSIDFTEALRNIEELIDPKPNDCYIDKMCFDVAHFCICQPNNKIITTDTLMHHFCIGYKRSSLILHQLVLRNVCKRLQNGGVVAIISIDQLNQMAREGKI